MLLMKYHTVAALDWTLISNHAKFIAISCLFARNVGKKGERSVEKRQPFLNMNILFEVALQNATVVGDNVSVCIEASG